MNRIRIKDLELFAYHGVYKEENTLGQRFVVSVDMFLDTEQAAAEDNIEASVNYGEVCHYIRHLMDKRFKLIEAVADYVAKELLYQYPLIDHLHVEVKKPEAPIMMPVDYVSVTASRGWHQVFLGIGSNMGDRKGYIDSAIRILKNTKDIKVTAVSTLIETKPYGPVAQEDFLNGCLEIRTLYSPTELLKALHKIEQDLDRERTIHWGPRTLDLDILFYDDLVMHTKNLIIPHKDLANRSFVLEPLAEIAGYVMHPVLKVNIEELALKLKASQQEGGSYD